VQHRRASCGCLSSIPHRRFERNVLSGNVLSEAGRLAVAGVKIMKAVSTAALAAALVLSGGNVSQAQIYWTTNPANAPLFSGRSGAPDREAGDRTVGYGVTWGGVYAVSASDLRQHCLSAPSARRRRW
jgi:hypothetical protein